MHPTGIRLIMDGQIFKYIAHHPTKLSYPSKTQGYIKRRSRQIGDGIRYGVALIMQSGD